MIKLLHIALFILIASQLFAQNVGVGVASPQEKLHIDGNLRGNQAGAVRVSTGSGYVDIGPKNGTWSHFVTDRPGFHFNKGITVDQGLIGSYSQDLQLQTNGTTRITALNSNGNIGIGTASPSFKLDVSGTGRFTGTLTVPLLPTADAHAASKKYVDDLVGAVAETDPTWSGAANTTGSISRTGNVGIGTGSPASPLDVNGNVDIRGSLDMNNQQIYNVNTITSQVDAVMPRIVLNSTGSGDDWTSQGAYISIGESGDLGSAALHMTYRGDGYAFIGSGAVTNAEPGASYFRFSYNTNNIYTPDKLEVGAFKMTSGAANNYVLRTNASGDAEWSDPSFLGSDDGLSARGIINKGSHNVATENLAAGIALSGSGSGTTATDGNKVVGSSYQGFGSGNSSGSAAESGYLQLDLGSAKTVSQHKIYFYNQDTRQYWFKLKYSYDGSTWHYAVGNASEWAQSAPTAPAAPGIGNMGYVTDVRVPTINARYWRLYANGSTANGGNHIYEWEVLREANPVALDIDDNLYVGGRVGIGVTTPSYDLHVNGRIKSNGINETSDIRFKKDIEVLENSLEKLMQLDGVSYYWRIEEFPDNKFKTGRELGVIAQEVEKIFPEVVDTDKEGYKSVQYSHLVPVLIEAIKELRAEKDLEINALKAELNEYKAVFRNIDIEKLERDYAVEIDLKAQKTLK